MIESFLRSYSYYCYAAYERALIWHEIVHFLVPTRQSTAFRSILPVAGFVFKLNTT